MLVSDIKTYLHHFRLTGTAFAIRGQIQDSEWPLHTWLSLPETQQSPTQLPCNKNYAWKWYKYTALFNILYTCCHFSYNSTVIHTSLQNNSIHKQTAKMTDSKNAWCPLLRVNVFCNQCSQRVKCQGYSKTNLLIFVQLFTTIYFLSVWIQFAL